MELESCCCHARVQGFFYNRYEPPAEAKGGRGTETGANKDQQARSSFDLCVCIQRAIFQQRFNASVRYACVVVLQ